MEGRNQFTFYRSYADAIRNLDPEDQLAVLTAVIDYALDGTYPQFLTGIQTALFLLIKPVLDTGRKKAEGGSKPKRSTKDTAKEKEKEVEVEVEKEEEKEVEVEDECLSGATGFESFWEQFPVKVGKARAKEAWEALQPDGEAVMAGLKRWKDSRQWNREDGRFIPRAWRWLREKQYLEHPEPENKPIWGATGELGKAELEAIQQVMKN